MCARHFSSLMTFIFRKNTARLYATKKLSVFTIAQVCDTYKNVWRCIRDGSDSNRILKFHNENAALLGKFDRYKK